MKTIVFHCLKCDTQYLPQFPDLELSKCPNCGIKSYFVEVIDARTVDYLSDGRVAKRGRIKTTITAKCQTK